MLTLSLSGSALTDTVADQVKAGIVSRSPGADDGNLLALEGVRRLVG
jgi:hypothetical protein